MSFTITAKKYAGENWTRCGLDMYKENSFVSCEQMKDVTCGKATVGKWITTYFCLSDKNLSKYQ